MIAIQMRKGDTFWTGWWQRVDFLILCFVRFDSGIDSNTELSHFPFVGPSFHTFRPRPAKPSLCWPIPAKAFPRAIQMAYP